eukprot:g74691.t1
MFLMIPMLEILTFASALGSHEGHDRGNHNDNEGNAYKLAADDEHNCDDASIRFLIPDSFHVEENEVHLDEGSAMQQECGNMTWTRIQSDDGDHHGYVIEEETVWKSTCATLGLNMTLTIAMAENDDHNHGDNGYGIELAFSSSCTFHYNRMEAHVDEHEEDFAKAVLVISGINCVYGLGSLALQWYLEKAKKLDLGMRMNIVRLGLCFLSSFTFFATHFLLELGDHSEVDGEWSELGIRLLEDLPFLLMFVAYGHFLAQLYAIAVSHLTKLLEIQNSRRFHLKTLINLCLLDLPIVVLRFFQYLWPAPELNDAVWIYCFCLLVTANGFFSYAIRRIRSQVSVDTRKKLRSIYTFGIALFMITFAGLIAITMGIHLQAFERQQDGAHAHHPIETGLELVRSFADFFIISYSWFVRSRYFKCFKCACLGSFEKAPTNLSSICLTLAPPSPSSPVKHSSSFNVDQPSRAPSPDPSSQAGFIEDPNVTENPTTVVDMIAAAIEADDSAQKLDGHAVNLPGQKLHDHAVDSGSIVGDPNLSESGDVNTSFERGLTNQFDADPVGVGIVLSMPFVNRSEGSNIYGFSERGPNDQIYAFSERGQVAHDLEASPHQLQRERSGQLPRQRQYCHSVLSAAFSSSWLGLPHCPLAACCLLFCLRDWTRSIKIRGCYNLV